MRNDNIWVFNAGYAFSGNPKWLFLYVKNHHPEIKTYWLCYNMGLVKNMKERGYKAYLFVSPSAKKISKKAWVYVVEQYKEIIQEELKGVKILNLWHGVGCKSVEKKVTFGFLSERIAKKYIRNNEIYKNYQMFLVTSPLMEEHFKKQCGLDDDMVIRAGYPCCIANEKAKSYDHDILKLKGLSDDAKIAVYSPTYRDASDKQFFINAIPDMDRLIEVLEEKNILLIFKMHPLMLKDKYYNEAMQKYKDCKNLLFWDNKNDIYEIFSKIDLAIIDYSSIFYDMLASGVKNFIRYMFDIENKNNLRDFVFDVKEMTCGYDCNNFDELLKALKNYEEVVEINNADRDRIFDLFWSYSKDAGNEEIVQAILDFKPHNKDLPTLYSFDIFDTLIKRRTLAPKGIFYYVQDEIMKSDVPFPNMMKTAFVRCRMQAEANVREWYKKTTFLRKSDRLEISLDEIYDRLKEVYGLSDEQASIMKELEIQAEIDNVIPYTENIDKLKELIAEGNKVILISDMYLPKEVISKMIEKADPILATLPLYLSNEHGIQKTTRKLFIKAYADMDYNFKKWIHFGDSPVADAREPKKLGIETINHKMDSFNDYELMLIDKLRSYDSFIATAAMARKRLKLNSEDECNKELFAYSYASLYIVPYVAWTVKDAIKRGIKTLYFISRDGYHLKRVADAIIEVKGYNIKTKYIYGSRRAWRIPSFVTEIDDEFFTPFGNIANIKSFSSLLKAVDMSEKDFVEMFPELAHLKEKSNYSGKLMADLREKLSRSQNYKEYLLKRAAEERGIVLEYLRQEIDFDEKYAFLEYWGRGYTQDCLTRLLDEAAGRPLPDIFYYSRSIYKTSGNNIRYNFTTCNRSMIFIEAIFANMPYKSVPGYKRVDGKVVPIINECDNDKELHAALEKCLVEFAKDVYSQKLQDEDRMSNDLFNFAMDYFSEFTEDPMLVNNIAHLVDSVEQYGVHSEFAPKITISRVFKRLFLGKYFRTKSIRMSIARSAKIYDKGYWWYKKKLKNGKLKRFIKRVFNKLKRISS